MVSAENTKGKVGAPRDGPENHVRNQPTALPPGSATSNSCIQLQHEPCPVISSCKSLWTATSTSRSVPINIRSNILPNKRNSANLRKLPRRHLSKFHPRPTKWWFCQITVFAIQCMRARHEVVHDCQAYFVRRQVDHSRVELLMNRKCLTFSNFCPQGEWHVSDMCLKCPHIYTHSPSWSAKSHGPQPPIRQEYSEPRTKWSSSPGFTTNSQVTSRYCASKKRNSHHPLPFMNPACRTRHERHSSDLQRCSLLVLKLQHAFGCWTLTEAYCCMVSFWSEAKFVQIDTLQAYGSEDADKKTDWSRQLNSVHDNIQNVENSFSWHQ